MEAVLLPVLIGIGTGIVVGALGAGGGILAVPVLVYLLGQDPHSATASSLVIVGVTALSSIIHHARTGNVAWRKGLLFAGISMLGAVLGARVSVLVPAAVLMGLFAAMLTVIAVAMLRQGRATRRAEVLEAAAAGPDAQIAPLETHDDPVLDVPGPDQVERVDGVQVSFGTAELPAAVDPEPRTKPLTLLLAALATGLLTGFFGVGGGFMVVPMLVMVVGLTMRRASGTSLLVMIVTTAVALLARVGTDVQIDWSLTLLYTAGAAAGGLLGGPLSAKARPSTLTLVFAALLAAVALCTTGSLLLG